MDGPTDLKKRLAAQITSAVGERLGRSDGQIARLIEQEVAAALGNPPTVQALMESAHQRAGDTSERIVITSTGRNRPGIVARLATVIDEFRGDIREISQTIVGDYYTVLFVVDVSGATSEGTHFATLRERLQQAGTDLGVHVVVIHDDILSCMHAV